MEDGFRLKEGMFFTVRCNVDDLRVLRLKELVMGHVMNSYEPKPFHFHRKMRRHVTDQDARELKLSTPTTDAYNEGKTSEEEISKSSGKSKVQQLWMAEHKKFSPGIQQANPKQKTKSQEVKASEKSESQKVSAANAGSEIRVNSDRPFAPRAESTEHECVLVYSESEIPAINNDSTQRASSSSSAHKPSSLNVLRDSWDRFLSRMRSERTSRRKLSMPTVESLLSIGGEQAPSGQTEATISAANRHLRITKSSMTQTSTTPISRRLSLPANDQVETAPAHRNIAIHPAIDSSGSRRSTAQHTLGTSSIYRSASKSLHQEDNYSIPAKHRKVSTSDGSTGNRQTSASIAQKYSTPEVKTSIVRRNYLATDSSGSRRSPAQHTLVTPLIDRCASKRLHQENHSSIPARHRKVSTSDVSTGNRQASLSIAHKGSTPEVKTCTDRRNIVTDSSGSRRSPAQHTLVTPLIDRCASKRFYQENNSSIPAKHRKASTSDDSTRNRQASTSIAQKHLAPEK